MSVQAVTGERMLSSFSGDVGNTTLRHRQRKELMETEICLM